MSHEVRPTTRDDLPELSRFLTSGFHAPRDAPFAAPDVLQWKYFAPRGHDAGVAPRSYVACNTDTGALVGHVGVCNGRFHGGGLPSEGVSALHMIDWLASGAGASLMRRAHQTADVQYGFGGSAAGRGVIDRGGYGLVALVPVVQRVLQPSYRLKDVSLSFLGRALRGAKDVAGVLRRPPAHPVNAVELRAVEAFGAEIEPLLTAYESHALVTTRYPDYLNYLTAYPRGGINGWQLRRDDVLRGFGILSVVARADGAREGRIVECLLDDPHDDDLWLASAVALTAELKRQGADVALAFTSTEWSVRAFSAAGFGPSHTLEFRLRDRAGYLPKGVPFHLSPLEADYAYI